MMRRLNRVLIALLCALLVVSMGASAAEAKKGKKGMRVSAVTRAGQDWYHGKLLVKWRAVPGASYQMRWAYTPSKLSYSRLVGSGTSGGTYTGTLDRGKTWYVQVRAVRSGQIGPWSKTRGLRFINYWPRTPALSRVSLPGAVQFKWSYTPYASRYRVRWSPAWYGNWPSSPSYVDRSSGGWIGQTARQSTYRVPATAAYGDNYLAVAYANPVFGQIEANNAYNPGASHRSQWVAAFPTPPTPAAGNPVRMGNYNVMLSPLGNRARAVAKNISSHEVTMVTLQEANAATANAVVSYLGANWRAAPSGLKSGVGQQILYRHDKFTLVGSDSFEVPNPKTPTQPLVTPWARFSAKGPGSQNFWVVSVHFSENSSKSPLEKNRDTGVAAQSVMRSMSSLNRSNEPTIVAGDMRYGREPYGDPAGATAAQPTFIRGGYYDSMAALKKVNVQYSIVNTTTGVPGARQVAHPSGLGPRSDHILFKGFVGSSQYVNVINWAPDGIVPSDHNLIYSDIAIPFR